MPILKESLLLSKYILYMWIKLQSVGHSIGTVVCVLNDEEILVKTETDSRYVVNAKKCVREYSIL